MADEQESSSVPSTGLSVEGTAREEHGLRAGGFWARGGALALDGFIILCFVALIGGLLSLAGVPAVLIQTFGVLSPFLYHGLCVGRWGRTPGKRFAGLAVLRADGSAVGYPRAFGRAFALLLSAATVFAGFIAAAFTPGRALHDRVAGTRVVRVADVPAWRPLAASLLGVVAVVFMALALIYPGRPPAGSDILSFEERRAATDLRAFRIGLARRAVDMGERGAEPYPETLLELVPDYLTELPPLAIGGHAETRLVESYPPELCREGDEGPLVDASRLKDTGRWGWIRGGTGACAAVVFMDCTHKDTNDRLWSSY